MERENIHETEEYLDHGHPAHKNRHRDNRGKIQTKVWLTIGAVVLIILLILWLTIADLAGDTDVAAQLQTITA
ncbi:MAG: hypothetical protein K2L49_00935 [Muribaculaceae bacterium]|nr:hypothetical protein [Muribaculaceae bacterium]